MAAVMSGVTNPPLPDPDRPPPPSCPRPSGCCCAWTWVDHYWMKGDDHKQCRVHQ